MDAKTRELRARIKRSQTKRGELSTFEPRGYGRKLKQSETFPAKRCEHIEGGNPGYIKKQRPKDGTWYSAGPIILGGTRCLNTAAYTNTRYGARCADHIGIPNVDQTPDEPQLHQSSPRSGQGREINKKGGPKQARKTKRSQRADG